MGSAHLNEATTVTADDREYLSSDKFISDIDSIIESFIIMKKVQHLEKFYFEKEFSSNTTVSLSDSDYFNNELAISLLKYFDAQTSVENYAW